MSPKRVDKSHLSHLRPWPIVKGMRTVASVPAFGEDQERTASPYRHSPQDAVGSPGFRIEQDRATPVNSAQPSSDHDDTGGSSTSPVDTTEVPSSLRCCVCAHSVDLPTVDKLTGLPDRWRWDAVAGSIIQGAQCRGEDLALLLVDLDSFKRINDNFGHMAGDAVLKAVADTLRASTRKIDLLGRYGGHGGDEFLVLLPETTASEAEYVAERIRTGIQAISLITTATTTGATVTISDITASVGISTCTAAEETTLDHLIRQVDHSLMLAKAEYHRKRTSHYQNPITKIDEDVFLGHLSELRYWVTDDWVPMILLALSNGPRKYADLLDAVRWSARMDAQTSQNGHVEPHVLIETLRRMEDHGLILRHGETAMRSWSACYQLSTEAHGLLDALTPMVLWCSQRAGFVSR